MQTHYEVLGVSEDATESAIRTTYLRLLQIYHPDHNKDPVAARRTAEIIEAYSILSDPQKRRDYDRGLHPVTSGHASDEKGQQPRRTHIEQMVCAICGVQDSTLRISLMYWVVSLIVITRRGGRSGVWCERCRAKQAAMWSAVTGTLGWWGFPWGPIYTIKALYFNAAGGMQDKSQNAALLRLVGFQLFEKGNLSEALSAIDGSIRLEKDDAAIRFAGSLRAADGSYGRKRLPIFKVLTAMPSTAFALLIVLGIVHIINVPTGYASRYTAPRLSRPSPLSQQNGDTSRDEVNGLVDSLASAVEEHATVVGTRHEGSKTTTLYELDREKYDPGEFDGLSKRIESHLEDINANSDGFTSSAFFNSRIMALSIEIENGMRAGIDVRPAIQEVLELGSDERITGWLTASAYAAPYAALKDELAKVELIYGASESRVATVERMEALKSTILERKSEFEAAKTRGDLPSARELATEHDEAVDTFNGFVKRHNRLIRLHNEIDLAFNRCLDPKILMSRFEQVDLTTPVAPQNALN